MVVMVEMSGEACRIDEYCTYIYYSIETNNQDWKSFTDRSGAQTVLPFIVYTFINDYR